MSARDDVLAANAAYADAFTSGDLGAPPARKLAIVTCMDARLDPARFLGLDAELLLVLAFVEYVALARASGLIIPAVAAGIAAALTAAAFARLPRGGALFAPLDVMLGFMSLYKQMTFGCCARS